VIPQLVFREVMGLKEEVDRVLVVDSLFLISEIHFLPTTKTEP